ncbi:MAG: hypothetical protein RLN88_11490 [Ekhidna sp.]|uniref:hypothetical protein n=1 Tax=Ekhidna sp. TaxID=2608089 RepID=UPI0032ED3939
MKRDSMEETVYELYESFHNRNPKELAFLHVDDRLFYSSSFIPFNLTIFDQFYSLSNSSKIVYVALLAEDGAIMCKSAFSNSNGRIKGSLKIPDEINSGNYQVIAYTKYMKNFDVDLVCGRALVYVQNLNEPPGLIAKSIGTNLDKSSLEERAASNTGDIIQFNEYKGKFLIRVDLSDQQQDIDYYLISEGFQSIQFVKKIRFKNRPYDLSIDKDQLISEFQKLILINERYEVVDYELFFLENDSKSDLSVSFSSNKLAPRQNVQMSFNYQFEDFGTVQFGNSKIPSDSLAFFKFIYRNYYNIPSEYSLANFTYDELIDTKIIRALTIYARNSWADILLGSNQQISNFQPETFIEFGGKVHGWDLDEGYLTAYFPNNSLNKKASIDSDGSFLFGIYMLLGKDYMVPSIFNMGGLDITPKYSIEISRDTIEYFNVAGYYDRSYTDSIIIANQKFEYVLSTFNEIDQSRYFWEYRKIDKVFKVSDYIESIASLEEFIRTAIFKAILTKDKGSYKLRIRNSEEETIFRNDPVIILNNEIVSIDEILKVPIEMVDEVGLVYEKFSLLSWGTYISDGVLIVKTHSNYEKKSTNNYPIVYGFSNEDTESPVHLFKSKLLSTFFYPSLKDQLNFTTGLLEGKFRLQIEMFSKEGIYNYYSRNFTIEN